jgi:hypothetical protein
MSISDAELTAIADRLTFLAPVLERVNDHGGYTCLEADSIVALYRTAGLHTLAQAILDGHTATDFPGDAHYVIPTGGDLCPNCGQVVILQGRRENPCPACGVDYYLKEFQQ